MNFSAVLKLFLYGINEEKESLRDLSTSLIRFSLQQETEVDSISYSQLSRVLNTLESSILDAIFQELLQRVHAKTKPNKTNRFYLLDSSTVFLSQKWHNWAVFRKSKAGVKLHQRFCFMDKQTMYPDSFTMTNAKEHDVNQLEGLVNKPEATYVFDRGYLNFQCLDQMHGDGDFLSLGLRRIRAYKSLTDWSSQLKKKSFGMNWFS